MDNIEINRIETPQQLESCAEVFANAFQNTYGDAWTKEKALEKLSSSYHSPKFRGWTVEQSDHMIGGCVGNIETYFFGDYFYLKEMFLRPESRHQGIGTKLIDRVKQDLQQEKIKKMVLLTSNEGLQFEFYEKNGFEEIGGMRMLMYGAET